MLENKWNNIAPEVPQDFHEKFEETLRHIEQADAVDKKYKRKRFSGRLLIAAAVICTGMGVTVAAKEFFKWNDHLLKRLEPSEEQQETMQESNYTQMIGKARMEMKVGLTFACMNLKKLAKMIARKGKRGTQKCLLLIKYTLFEPKTRKTLLEC